MFLKIWKVRGSSFYGLFFCISKGLLSKVGNVLPACQSSPFSVSSHQREALSNYSELHLVPPLLCNYCVFLGQCFKCHLLLFVCLFFPEYEDRCKLRKVKDNILKYISNKYKRIWGKKTHKEAKEVGMAFEVYKVPSETDRAAFYCLFRRSVLLFEFPQYKSFALKISPLKSKLSFVQLRIPYAFLHGQTEPWGDSIAMSHGSALASKKEESGSFLC